VSPLILDAVIGDVDWLRSMARDLPRDPGTIIRTELGTPPPKPQRVTVADFPRLAASPRMRGELPQSGVLPR
jgi:hypothetical protein